MLHSISLAASAVAVVYGKPVKVPDDSFCRGKLDGVYTKLGYCSGFYMCAHGITFTHTCPDDLRFNSKTMQCDWKEQVNCLTDGSLPGIPKSVLTDTSKLAIDPSSKFQAALKSVPSQIDESDISLGHTTASEGHNEQTPELIQVVQNRGDHSVAKTKTFQVISPKKPSTNNVDKMVENQSIRLEEALEGRPSNGFCARLPDGNYKGHVDCKSFVTCHVGFTHTMICPEGLIFDETKDWCVRDLLGSCW